MQAKRFKMDIMLFNHKTGKEKIIKLPTKDLEKEVESICFLKDLRTDTLVADFYSAIDFQDSEFIDIQSLNNTLLKICMLQDWEQERVFDLFLESRSKNLHSLNYILDTYMNYEPIPIVRKDARKIVAGLVLLSILTDKAVNTNLSDELTDDELEKLLMTGIKAGYVIMSNGKYYVKDFEMVERFDDYFVP